MTQITADWKDVQQKAYRLLIDSSIECDAISTFSILCTSHGDNGTYQTYVNNKSRVTKDNAPSKANWYCTCPWGEWSNTGRRPHDGEDSYGTVKSNNRMCSHAYAAYLMLQQYRKVSKEQNKIEDEVEGDTEEVIDDTAPVDQTDNSYETYEDNINDEDSYDNDDSSYEDYDDDDDGEDEDDKDNYSLI